MRSHIRTVRDSLLYGGWPWSRVAARIRPRALLLVYHRIANAPNDPYAVSPDVFELHLRLLRRYCHVLSLDALLEQLPRGGYLDRTVVVTFDDGYADNLTTAYPIAAGLAIPLTLFATVQPVVEGKLFWWDELDLSLRHAQIPEVTLTFGGETHLFSLTSESNRCAAYQRLHSLLRRMPADGREHAMAAVRTWGSPLDAGREIGRPMTVAELQTFSALPGVTVGAHTLTHPMLGALPPTEQVHELTTSKVQLEALLGRPVSLVSYPFGQPTDLSGETLHAVRGAGYRAGFTAIPAAVTPSVSPYALPRFIVHDWSEKVFLEQLGRFLRTGRDGVRHHPVKRPDSI